MNRTAIGLFSHKPLPISELKDADEHYFYMDR